MSPAAALLAAPACALAVLCSLTSCETTDYDDYLDEEEDRMEELRDEREDRLEEIREDLED
jgi:hypothetical protein